MAKVGLKDTLALLAKGYSKKEIDALAAVDEEHEQEEISKHENQEKEEKPSPVEEKKNDEPDYKAMYEELLEKNKKTEETIKKIQKDNINSDSSPAAEEQLKAQQDALTNLVRGFM